MLRNWIQRTCNVKQVAKYLGQEVHLNGWIQSIRHANERMTFVILRDHQGHAIQLVTERNDGLKVESSVTIKGTVTPRPGDAGVEIQVTEMQVCNEAENIPFEMHPNAVLPAEDIRLKYRFLDLRRPTLAKNLRLRSEAMQMIRQILVEDGFMEVETPLLFKATAEGAREFLVPSRTSAGLHYALPQSPQQFKQMLMAAGVDRYFQIAKCFRDEDLRSDRQPEFTQVDLEMAWATPHLVMAQVEKIIKGMVKLIRGQEVKEIPRMTYDEAMATYGSDKPDLRFGCTIQRMETTGECLVEMLPYNDLIPNKETALTYLDSVTVPEGHELKFLEEGIQLRRPCHDHVGSTVLGEMRLQAGKNAPKSHGLHFLWVIDFPLLEKRGDRLVAMHHPFTAPHPDDALLLETDPLKVRGLHYDLVLNGCEVAGGSIRIHRAVDQLRMFREVMGMPESDIEAFSHLLTALRMGCPPHGGLAIGLDRLLAMLLGANSIRDVIAFPKNGRGHDLCVGAPS